MQYEQRIEDEYDNENEVDRDESDESGEDDEDEDEEEDEDDEDDDDMESDNDDNDDDEDRLVDMFSRRQQRRREAEAVQDIINAPNQDQRPNDYGMPMPIEDVGLQPRYMGRNRDQQIGENWSVEERQVQRTLALLRGIRPSAPIRPWVPRNPFGRNYYQQQAAFPGEREEERAEQQSNRSAKPSKLSDLTSVFLPLESKEILSFIMDATSWLHV